MPLLWRQIDCRGWHLASLKKNLSNSMFALLLVASLGIQRSIPILLLPVAARCLTASEFGQISIFSGLTVVLGILLSRGTASIVSKFKAEQEAIGNRTALIELCKSTLKPAWVVTLILISTCLSIYVFTSKAIFEIFALVALTAFVSIFLGIFLAVNIALSRSATSLFSAVIQVFFTLFISIYSLPAFGIAGYFISLISGGTFALIFQLLVYKESLRISERSNSVTKQEIKIWRKRSRPFVYQGLASWGLTYPDKLLIVGALGASILGSYQVSVSVAGIVALFLEGIASFWAPKYIKNSIRNRENLFGMGALLALLALCLNVLVIVNFKSLVTLLAPNYEPLTVVTAIICVGAIPRAFYFIYSVKLNDEHKNMNIFASTIIGSLAALLLGLPGVYLFGALGVASAIAIGFTVQGSLTIIYAENKHKTLKISGLCIGTIVLGLLLALVAQIDFQGFSSALSILFSCIGLFVVLLVFKER